MKITTSTTRIELDFDEEKVLKEAIEILKNVNGVIGSNTNVDYVVDRADMILYDSLYDEVNRIEDWVTAG